VLLSIFSFYLGKPQPHSTERGSGASFDEVVHSFDLLWRSFRFAVMGISVGTSSLTTSCRTSSPCWIQKHLFSYFKFMIIDSKLMNERDQFSPSRRHIINTSKWDEFVTHWRMICNGCQEYMAWPRFECRVTHFRHKLINRVIPEFWHAEITALFWLTWLVRANIIRLPLFELKQGCFFYSCQNPGKVLVKLD
jgi:hypothetical protein